MAKSRNRESWSIELRPVGPRRAAGSAAPAPLAPGVSQPVQDVSVSLENLLRDLFDAVAVVQKSIDEINERLGSVEDKITQLQEIPRRAPRERRERPLDATEAITRAVRPRPARRPAAEPPIVAPPVQAPTAPDHPQAGF